MGPKKKRLVLIGPVPPPLGGVSMHLQRLGRLLKDDFEIDWIDESKTIKESVFNLRNLHLIQYVKKIWQADILSVHSGLRSLRYFHILTAKILGKKIVLSLHAYPDRKGWIKRKADEKILGWANRIIIVNEDFLGRLKLPARKTVVKFAFLPPIMEDEAQLPKNIEDWIEDRRKQGHKIICANAWRLDRFNDQDLYGVDLCIELARRMQSRREQASIIFNIATIDRYGEDYEKYQQQIRELAVENHIWLINESLSFVRLMEKSDLVLRPTNTDGDSLTIREAIYLGKPIIASDVIERPAHTILFRNRDIDDLEKCVLATISNPTPVNFPAISNSADEYHSFYKSEFLKVL